MPYEGRPKAIPTRILECPVTRIEAFAKNFTIEADGCWRWTARLTPKGYGIFWVIDHERSAHRIMWELIGRPVDFDKELDHLCDNKACVNPSHLQQVTPLENNQNKIRKPYCRRGHLWSENAVPYESRPGKIHRRCKACARLRANLRYQSKRRYSASMTSSATPLL